VNTQTKCLKRALKADGKGGLHLDCECGERIPVPVIKGLPMTYECGKCGIVYDSRGWIIGKRESEGLPSATDLDAVAEEAKTKEATR
jgi:hypothetical protein